MDSGSANGTWINNTKFESDKKYRLSRDDVTDFAHRKKSIFDMLLTREVE